MTIRVLPKPQCGNCTAWLRTGPDRQTGVCRAIPPVPIFLGMGTGLLGGQPTPQIISYFPPMMVEGWCRMHEPTEPPHSEH